VVYWNADHLDDAGLIAELAASPSNAAPGERFRYSNLAYAVGGFAAAAAAGAAPERLDAGYRLALRDRVLNPIGMTRSTFDLGAALATGDVANPHGSDLEGQPEALRLLAAQCIRAPLDPAVGLWS